MKNLEPLCSGLSSVIETTEDIFRSVGSADIGSVHELIERREQQLAHTMNIAEQLDLSGSFDDERMCITPELDSLINSALAQDKKLVDLLEGKRDEFWERLQQAENQKRLLVYSR